ncbi:MAG: hypothetical protein V1487_04390 [bacterium]
MDNKAFLSRSLKYFWIALVVGVITALFITPFLAPIFFKFGNLFDKNFLGYRDAYDTDWYGLTAAITSSFFALVVLNEFKSDTIGDEYSYDIDLNKVKFICIKFIKFFAIFISYLFLFSVATYILFLITNLLSKWA